MSKDILPGAGPFYFKGNDTGIIILHGGGGGTCADLKQIAEDLHNQGGYTVKTPLLPGFGTNPEHLRKISINTLKSAVDTEIKSLKKECNKIILGGHSMGGILTLIAASKHELNGIFTIAAPIGLKGFIHKLVPFFKLFIKYYPVEWEKLEEETNGKWIGYKKIPLNIVKKMKELISEMRKSLPKITYPALIMQGQLDSVIKASSSNYIVNNINSKVKKHILLRNNDHPILDSPDHNIIVSEIKKFVDII